MDIYKNLDFREVYNFNAAIYFSLLVIMANPKIIDELVNTLLWWNHWENTGSTLIQLYTSTMTVHLYTSTCTTVHYPSGNHSASHFYKNILFQGHKHLLFTGTDDPTLDCSLSAREGDNQSEGSSVPVVSWWLYMTWKWWPWQHGCYLVDSGFFAQRLLCPHILCSSYRSNVLLHSKAKIYTRSQVLPVVKHLHFLIPTLLYWCDEDSTAQANSTQFHI